MKMTRCQDMALLSPEYWLTELEIRVADAYSVYPVDSKLAYEEFEGDGGIKRVVHTVFAVSVSDNTPTSIAQAVELIWADMRSNFRQGSLVVWRRRPVLEETESVCDCCGTTVKKFVVRCRIGCMQDGIPKGDTVKEEGRPCFNLRKGAYK